MKGWQKKLPVLLLFAGLLVLVHSGWPGAVTDNDQIRDLLESQGQLSLLWLTGAGALFTAAGGPRQAVAFISGFSLGPLGGTLLATLATLLGAALCFFSARLLFQQSLKRRYRGKLKRVARFFENRPFASVVMVRLMPVGSNLLTNLLAGASDMRVVPFLAGSGIGYIPQMLIFALAGSGLAISSSVETLLSLALFVLASTIGAYLYRTHRAELLLADSA